MICKQLKYKEDEASKPQRRRTDGALLLPEVHLRPRLTETAMNASVLRERRLSKALLRHHEA